MPSRLYYGSYSADAVFGDDRYSTDPVPNCDQSVKIVSAILIAFMLVSGVSPADQPVGQWRFQTPMESASLTAHGNVKFEQTGPRPPEFPDFGSDNHAVYLDGEGSYLSIDDEGENSRFDFSVGDAITLQAWVKIESAANNHALYVVGKGRTNSPDFARDNQNWALRVATSNGLGRISFLFATKPGSWHRWDSNGQFNLKAGWHHVAAAYLFGHPESIRGWIDGVPTDGAWSFAGPTDGQPVVDDDAVWIGSSLGGNPSNSIRGWLDDVAIHRRLLSDEEIAAQFNRVGGSRVLLPQAPSMPELGEIARGAVRISIGERLSTHARWPSAGEAWPEESTVWNGDSFLLPRIPLRYDDWGIRDAWVAPLLVRMAADVELQPGEHKFLLRARALSRLWVNGQLVAQTDAITKRPPDGEERILPIPAPVLPGIRLPGYRQQDAFGSLAVSPESGRVRVVLEMVVGGKDLRTETGEVCVAVQSQDGSVYEVLRPVGHSPLTLTDAAIEPELLRIETVLASLDDQTRRHLASSQDAFWNRRHDEARAWCELHPPSQSPDDGHPVDAFIAAKIDRAKEYLSPPDSRSAVQFHDRVLPILRVHCFRCHDDNAKGGLDLTSRESLLRGGESESTIVDVKSPEISELILRCRSDDPDIRMPPTGRPLSEDQIKILETWIASGAEWPAPPVRASELMYSEQTNDETFLRRVYLDTIGVPPTVDQAGEFLGSQDPDKRGRLISRLLENERCADNWISEWLDLLAENPTLLNKSQGSTGPFRFFLHDSLRDNKPIDRMVTELILMRGGAEEGGSAGFALAAENDAPFAGKAHIIASAFLGVELQCARCHDAPFHNATQHDLFSLAAMLQRKPAKVPGTSSVPAEFFDGSDRLPLIKVTLVSGEPVVPAWPFETLTGICDDSHIDQFMHNADDSRERLAALITAPENVRFPRVIVNRIWRRLMGIGLIEPVGDWEGQAASHPDLLDWLAHQFVSHGYDAKHVDRLIMTSAAYQRAATGHNSITSPERRFFNAPEVRRLKAEQIVDSLYSAVGKSMDVGELTFVHDGRRPLSNRQTLGHPKRAWMLASLNNERDRPSLSLPRARAVTDVLEAFGWTGSRQKPIANRNLDPNVLQPGVLANGVLATALMRASNGSALAQLAVDAKSPGELVDALFLRILTRRPNAEERAEMVASLSAGFEDRLVPKEQVTLPQDLEPLRQVTWFNHGRPDANSIQQEIERRVRAGPPADPRLVPGWREVYEDVAWSLINHREFVWMP